MGRRALSDTDQPSARKRPAPSLEARALGFLSRREHSRLELQHKLAPHAPSPELLEALLDKLQARRLLSQERFAESVVHRRADRFGSARIRQELKSHQLDQDTMAQVLAPLKASEFQRAQSLWQRRFGGELAADRVERLKQMRFLAARGFDLSIVRRVVGGRGDDDGGEAL